ncbi:MAG: efflux RND transporter periplasmic adaptor subunit [Planctomycetales bacterium]|nr:efflux RND transporter periplasmic adaptor subunit [Planctomycetales bacterium]
MSTNRANRRFLPVLVFIGCLLAFVAGLMVRSSPWLKLAGEATSHEEHEHETHDHEAADDHADHDHDHEAEHGHDEHDVSGVIELSENGLKNIGFQPFTIQPAAFEKKLTLPAIVVERPGRSQIHITAPLTGVVTEIYSVTGEAVLPDQPLFEMRLTHEELVTAQRDFLRTAESLDVVNREIARLNSLGEGVVAGRRILEQEYEKQKLEASLHAETEAMLLHGISSEQVAEILETRRLLGAIVVRAPRHKYEEGCCSVQHLLQIQRLEVARGEQVEAGQELAVLGDHCELHLEGLAFEDDAQEIRLAAQLGKVISASPLARGSSPGATVTGLEVLYVADQIDTESRAFRFYVRLPNEVAYERDNDVGKQFIEWRFKPGQRMQLDVPIETWEDQLVLPTTAVVDEGAEMHVYRQDGSHFDQVSVHVVHRDATSVVIKNDGTLIPGDVIAGNGAYQMHLALKNQAGGGIDPHAGHNH